MLLEDQFVDDLVIPKTGDCLSELGEHYPPHGSWPAQGSWTEEDYLQLTDGWNRLIEFTDGYLEFLPMPNVNHQEILAYLFAALLDFVRPRKLGKVLFTGLRIRIRPDKIREPDLCFLSAQNYHLRDNRLWSGADLVMEVVSEGSAAHERDHAEKVADYAEAGIAEYWIVDPQTQQIDVLTLNNGVYETHGKFIAGQAVSSKLLAGFVLEVNSVFAASQGE